MFRKETALLNTKGNRIQASLKKEPDHFKVNEILPAGLRTEKGPHLCLKIRKIMLNTENLRKLIADFFRIPEAETGYAGLKDSRSVTVQHFSIPAGALRGEDPEKTSVRINEYFRQNPETAGNKASAEVIDFFYINEKLRRGMLERNEFEILALLPESDGASGDCTSKLNNIYNIYNELKSSGFPNYFGEQRFGRDYSNVLTGRRILSGSLRPSRHIRDLCLSAVQSYFFNLTLSHRIAYSIYSVQIPGDHTEDGRITGPLHGPQSWNKVSSDALALEMKILESENMNPIKFEKAGLSGGRRVLSVNPENFSIRSYCDQNGSEKGIWFYFSLPKGSYATSVLREFLITDNEETE